MEIPTFMIGVLPSKKREELISKRNVRVIKKFFREREKLQIAKKDDLARLKKLRKNRSINSSIYNRLKEVMILTYEQKRIELINSTTQKSLKVRKTVVNDNN
jgi:hypothetical protein